MSQNRELLALAICVYGSLFAMFAWVLHARREVPVRVRRPAAHSQTRRRRARSFRHR
jgi:hypothetical protein